MTNNNQAIGVIIGRFHVNELHDAHRDIINQVISEHKRVILFLGVSPVIGTRKNPLDFTSRKKMLQSAYPDITVLSLPDHRDDKQWSKNLDNRVREIYPMGKVILYGGRDSFIPHYSGSFETKELEQTIYVSGTEIRQALSEDIKSSADWRAGVIFSSYNRFSTSYQTVDIAAFNTDKTQLLLAKKPNETKYRFVGGFVDPKDPNLESAAEREYVEETGGSVDDLQYIGSFRVDDWRYRNEDDKIMTVLFTGIHISGAVFPADDISELRWIPIAKFHESGMLQELIIEEHQPLMVVLLNKIKQ